MSGHEHNTEALAAVQGGTIISARLCDCGCGIPVLLVRKRRGGPVIRVDVVADHRCEKPGTLVLEEAAT